MKRKVAMNYLRTIRGKGIEEPDPSWLSDKSGRFGEDLIGGWLLENGGRIEGLQGGARITIPLGGNSNKRRTDWLVGKRIVVEVKTYNNSLGQGGYATNTHQIEDLALWRDQRPEERAVVLARVAWNGNSGVDQLFKADIRHFKIPLVHFLW
jgi:hypothetical protein